MAENQGVYNSMIKIPLNLEGIWLDKVELIKQDDYEERYLMSIMWGTIKVYEFEFAHDYEKLIYFKEHDSTLAVRKVNEGKEDETYRDVMDMFFDKVEEITRKMVKEYALNRGDSYECYYEEFYADKVHKLKHVDTDKEDVEYTYIGKVGTSPLAELHPQWDYLVKLLPTLLEIHEIRDTSRRFTQAFGVDTYYILLGDTNLYKNYHRFDSYVSLGEKAEFKATTLKTNDRTEALERAKVVKKAKKYKIGEGEIIWVDKMDIELSTEDYLSIFS